MDQAYYHEQQLQVQHDIEQALAHARALGLSKDEVSLLAWASGIHLNDERTYEQRNQP